VKVGPTVWKSQVTGDGPSEWNLVATPSVPPSPNAEGSKAAPVRSVVAIENGLTVDDLVVVNGLTKARPGAAVAPESWELRPPREPAATK
jgi:hypothetical protein